MESRAKQRLTGAIILVALFVLLVPELLTGPRTVHPDAQGQGDEGVRRYTIDLDARRSPAAPSTPAAEPAVALPPVATPMAADPARAVPGESAVAAPSTAPPAQAAAQKNVSPGAATPTTQPTAARTEPARVEPPRQSAPNRVEPGSFAVQLGTFGKRENADRLARDMTAKGFAAFVVPTTNNGHDLFRVRVGPARDRAAAEALAAELKRAGQSGSVVPIS